MPSVEACIGRDIHGKVSSAASKNLIAECLNFGDCIEVAGSPDGRTLVAVTESGLVVAYEKARAGKFAYGDLHSVSVIGDADTVLFAPLQRDVPFDAVRLTAPDAVRLASRARQLIAEVHDPGTEWWDTPEGELGVTVWPAGLLTRPNSSPVQPQQWCTLAFVNTGIQIRTFRHPQHAGLYRGDAREFLPWPDVRNVAVEGLDQVERRPSVGAVAVFGVLGLSASKEIRRAYVTIEATAGDYVFEVQDVLPLTLSGFLAAVLRQMNVSAVRDDDPIHQVIAAQLETNRLLEEILTALRAR